ncbi:TonB-dependent receptor domain-containing protein [Luteimonas sp. e5]
MPLLVAMLGCLYGASAMAQSQPAQEPESEPETPSQQQDTQALETVTVTGSLLRRKEYETVAPVQIITTDTSVAVGQIDTAEFLQQSSVAAGSTQIANQFAGYVTEGGIGAQTISLRGLGANRTLVLLNGARPGPAGTRGQVGAFDLNVIPQVILQRAEIVKDGTSSIYGSDAVAGVVNLITRKNIDRPEISIMARGPLHSGGESLDVSGVTGWNFNTGNLALAASYYKQRSMKVGDRDFFRCAEDLVWDAEGNRIDREDRSILAGTEYANCNMMLFNAIDDALTGVRYVPSPDGVSSGPFPGWRPRANTTYANSPQASYEEVLNGEFLRAGDVFSAMERFSVYGSADFNLGGSVNWTSEVLFNQRKTEARRFRQFFPIIGGSNAIRPGFGYANDPDFVNPVPSGVARPIMPFRSNTNVKVDYYYVNTGFDGLLPFGDWSWKANTSYSRSKGTYNGLAISASRSGDVQYSDDAPTLDYFDPGFLDGSRMDELVAAIGQWDRGVTTYDQFVVNAVATGELFQLPAGGVGVAIGAEYRRYSIDDQPGELSRAGDLWGQSSAQVTKGKDSVKELFAEVEVPILKAVPAFETLTFNASGRVFDYDSVGDSDSVWKAGLNWQIVPSLRLRATRGTSFRAPGLYELYLGNQSGFVGQLAIDPCVRWGESSNDHIRANCAAAGIPDDYAGGAASARVFTGGGAGFLQPETSTAFNAGFVWTPSFAPLSLAFDYFKYEVKDEIASLGAGDILAACYGAPVYPNNYCSMFTRNPNNDPTAPNAIGDVYATYININRQMIRGYDLIMRFDKDFNFGSLEMEGNFSYLLEDVEQVFDSAAESGYDSTDWVGYIARPKLVGNYRTSLKRGDWTFTWAMDYVGSTKNTLIQPTFTYQGFPNAVRKITAESQLYHALSVGYRADKWSLLVGMRNVFDAKPPVMTTGTATRYGNIPAFATQYDWYGRTLYARYNYRF